MEPEGALVLSGSERAEPDEAKMSPDEHFSICVIQSYLRYSEAIESFIIESYRAKHGLLDNPEPITDPEILELVNLLTERRGRMSVFCNPQLVKSSKGIIGYFTNELKQEMAEAVKQTEEAQKRLTLVRTNLLSKMLPITLPSYTIDYIMSSENRIDDVYASINYMYILTTLNMSDLQCTENTPFFAEHVQHMKDFIMKINKGHEENEKEQESLEDFTKNNLRKIMDEMERTAPTDTNNHTFRKETDRMISGLDFSKIQKIVEADVDNESVEDKKQAALFRDVKDFAMSSVGNFFDPVTGTVNVNAMRNINPKQIKKMKKFFNTIQK
jgi:hypothetical protein